MTNIVKVFITLIILIALTKISTAEIVCRSDAFGDTVCKDRKTGREYRKRTDAFGRETWRDREGNIYESRTDAFGNKSYRDNKGNTYYEKTDAFGNTIIKNEKGKEVLKCSTNAFGEYVSR